MPQVSVILPVHNGMPYLPATIESLRAQTMQDFEVILVDDASDDESPAYINSLTDERFRYFRLERTGIASALNFGSEQARSKLIARIDADDIAYPNRFELQLAAFARNSALVLLGSSFDTIDRDGKITGEWHCLASDLANRWLMLFTTPFPHPGVMFRRSAVVAAGGYDPACPVAQDYDLWVRLAEQGQVGNLAEKLIQKRAHTGAWGHQHSQRQRETASNAAARYAQRLRLMGSGEVYRQLYAFLWWAELPLNDSATETLAAFSSAVDHFTKFATAVDTEFWRSVAYFRRRLSWRCHEQARRHWTRPLQAATWLGHARAVDPQNGGLLNTVQRKLRQSFGHARQELESNSYAVC